MSRLIETLIFWAVMLAGAAALAPCLILPAWVEYQESLVRLKEADQLMAAQQKRLEAAERQRAHWRQDDSYFQHVAREELGAMLKSPDDAALAVADPNLEPLALDDENIADDPNAADVLPELSAVIAVASQRYPYMGVFLHPTTRPLLMAVGAGLLLTGVALLGGAGTPRRPEPPE